jgi:hypothetical protein
MNMALAVDMPDAPVTQDTVTAGSDGDDEDQGDDDQEDAPVTQDTINEGGESDDDANDDDDDESDNNDNDNDPISKDSPTTSKSPRTEIECPKGQEVRLFSASCQPSQPDTECEGQGQAQLEGQQPESGEVETEFSVSNEGNYASQCVPALQFGNTGNLNNQESSGSLPTVP